MAFCLQMKWSRFFCQDFHASFIICNPPYNPPGSSFSSEWQIPETKQAWGYQEGTLEGLHLDHLPRLGLALHDCSNWNNILFSSSGKKFTLKIVPAWCLLSNFPKCSSLPPLTNYTVLHLRRPGNAEVSSKGALYFLLLMPCAPSKTSGWNRTLCWCLHFWPSLPSLPSLPAWVWTAAAHARAILSFPSCSSFS